MADSDPPAALPPLQHRAVRHKFRASLLISGVVAIGLVLGSDRLLRARENLVSGIAAKNVQQFLPLNDLLATKVERKTNYNHLYEKIAASRSKPDHTEFANTSYELSAFITAELDESDPRRRDAMLDVVAVAGDAPISNKAYWALLDPAWKNELRPQYPAYAAAITKFAQADGKNAGPTLVQLAQVLQANGEPQLELSTLRTLRTSGPVTVATTASLERLAGLLPPNDTDRDKLQADLQAFQKRREQLAASMEWYQGFVAKAPSGKLDDLEALRQKAPAGDTNAFIASADAMLATAYAKLGRFDDANKLRTALAQYDMADAEDCVMLVAQVTGSVTPVPGKNAAPMAQPPDLVAIQLQAWRGHLLLGQIAQADKLESEVFIGELKGLKKQADDEKLLATGAISKLSPSVVLKKRTDNLPAELAEGTEAWYAQFTLKPTAKTSPTNIHTVGDLWVTKDKIVVVVNADEPRKELTPATATARDKPVWSDESIELFFDQDHWFDMYYQIDANTAGTIFDARVSNTGSMTRRQYIKPDTSLTLAITTQTTQTDTGWQMRFVLPRAPLLPEANGAIKFNIRRFRRVTTNKIVELQQYSWTGIPGTDHRPEQFGWLVIPK